MKRTILSLALTLLISPLFAQVNDIAFQQANFPEAGKEFKAARKNLKKGLKQLGQDDVDYYETLQLLLTAQRFNPNYSVLNKAIGACYLNLNIPDSSLKYLKRSLELNPEQEAIIHFELARSFHQGMQFDLAVRKYNDYLNLLSTKELKNDSSMVNKFITEARFAKKMTSENARAYVDLLPAPLNSRWDEFLPLATKSDSLLIFTSNRPSEGKKKKEKLDIERVFFRINGPENQLRIEAASRKLQGGEYHASAVYIERTGDLIYVRKGNKPAELYRFKTKKGKWVGDGKLENKLLRKGYITSMSVSADTSMLAMSVNPTNGNGNSEIYIAYRKNRSWSKPELAYTLNTPFNEMGVCFHPVKKTLYFSSRGHNSSGGYDLFETEFTDSGWTTPRNLGFPINTPFDELFLSFTGEGRIAYYSSNRNGGQGGLDLYQVSFLGDEKQLATIRQEPATFAAPSPDPMSLVAAPSIVAPDESVLQTVVINLLNGGDERLQADILISDQPKPTKKKIRKGASAITLELPLGREYTFFIYSNVAFSSPIHINLRDSVNVDTLQFDCKIIQIESGEPINLSTIRFYPDSAEMIPESLTSAQWLVYFLKIHPQYSFELSSHVEKSDDISGAIELSSLRASRLSAWLVERGGTASQIIDKGYGFDVKPEQDNTAERLELKLLMD